MTDIRHLLIAFSQNFPRANSYEKVIGNVLAGRRPTKISVINDELNLVSLDTRLNASAITKVKCRTRLDARKIVSQSSHIVCFWSGEDLTHLIWEARHQKIPLRISTFSYTRAVNRDAGDEFDIYIGRSGPWGNPFPIIPGTEETRERVIEKYTEYFEKNIITDPGKHAALLSLRGLRLGCHCKPLACHGDIIARYLNNYSESDKDASDMTDIED